MIDEKGPPTLAARAYRVKDFCLTYGIGRTRLYEEIAAGRLRAIKLGTRTLIPADAAAEWFDALPQIPRNQQTTYEIFARVASRNKTVA